uniref:Protein kinase Ukc1p n=1 Tax=Ganoderma boninense TaxID=34458 RepID=A0A5K1K2L8_9APHY
MPTDSKQNPSPIHLSWAQIVPESLEFFVDPSHAHFHLYQSLIDYIRSAYSPSSLNGSAFSAWRSLLHHHPTFGTLVNLLANRHSLTEEPVSIFDLGLSPSSTLDFILFGLLHVLQESRRAAASGVLYYAIDGVRGHVPVAARQGIELYQAALLDFLRPMWEYECRARQEMKSSPMPWSRASRDEKPPIEDSSQLTVLIVPPEIVSLDDNHPMLRAARLRFGYPLDVPWLGGVNDGYPFSPTLSIYVNIRRRSATPSFRDDVALWLGAMTFGLLEIVTRYKVTEVDLLSPTSGGDARVLSGTRLERFLFAWSHHMREAMHHGTFDKEVHRIHGRRLASVLNQALAALDEEGLQGTSLMLRAGFPVEMQVDLLGALTLAIGTLCKYALANWHGVPEMEDISKQLHDTTRYFHRHTKQMCRRVMLPAGWCPHIVSTQFLNSIDELSLLSHIVREKPFIRNTPDEHAKCTEAACVLYTIDMGTYSARHVDPHCYCAKVTPSLQDIIKLLSGVDSTAFPVVAWDGMRLRVQPAVDGQYVAISHVWADGLGAFSEIGLPACQIARLAALVKEAIPETGAFWMDSLCVPREPTLRARALKLLPKTYKEAAKVLVVDASVRAQCAKDRPWEENLFRIVMSGWSRRLWTAQEGVVARRLLFEFSDGLVDVTDRLRVDDSSVVLRTPKADKAQLTRTSSDGRIEHTEFNAASLYRSCFTFLALHAAYQINRNHQCTIDQIIDLVRHRMGTHPDEEALALAGLLPVDVDALLSISGPNAADLRMKALLLQLRDIPLRLPMLQTQRLNIPGFRWAPRSFTGANESMAGGDSGTCSADGLSAEYSLARFESSVAIPALCVQGLKDTFKIAITQHGSTCIYEAFLSMPLEHYRSGVSGLPLSVDGFIFTHAELPKDSRIISCAAVASRLGEHEAEDGVSQGVVKCDYVASVELWCSSDAEGAVEPRAQMIAAAPDVYGLYKMGNLGRAKVLLR